MSETTGVVARCTAQGYAEKVRRSPRRPWVVIILLVTRLVFGEMTHASAQHDAHADDGSATTSQEQSPCPDHVNDGSEASATDTNDSASESPENDCCKSGGCECPCLHTPAAIAVVPVIIAHQTRVRAAASEPDVAVARPFTVFRPPA